MGFLQLVHNENMKLYRRLSTWIMVGLILLFIGGMTYRATSWKPISPDWKQKLIETNQRIEKELVEDKKNHAPEMYLKSQMNKVKMNQYRIDHNLKPSNGNRFLQGSQDLAPIIELLTIIVASGIVASEFSWGTMKLLTLRPYKRWKILLSKYLAVLLFTLFLLTIAIVVTIIAGLALFGTEGMFQDIVLMVKGEIITKSTLPFLLQNFGLNMVSLVMMSTFAFMISTIFRNQAMASGLAFIFIFIGKQLSLAFAAEYDWAKYNFLVNTDWIQYINGTPMLEGMSLTFSVTVCAVYYLIFMAASFYLFQKRDLAG